MNHRFCILFATLALGVGVTGTLQAQSTVVGGWPGALAEGVDAGSRAAGGVGMGGPGIGTLLANPAELAILPGSVFQGSFVSQRTVPSPEIAGPFSSVRFPQLHAGFRLTERWAVGAGFDGLLNHGLRVERRDTLVFREDTLAVLDVFEETGGLSAFRAGVGYAAARQLSFGVGAVLYSGSTQRNLSRTFGNDPVPSAQAESIWSFSGAGLSAGARWGDSERAVSGVVESGGSLRVAGEEDQEGEGDDFRMPTTLSLGASSRLTGDLYVRLGGRWAGWSAHDEEMSSGARDYLLLGGGIELRPREESARGVPVRLGYRWSRLPFRETGFAGGDFADEQVLSLGIGARLATGAIRPDLAIERGSRSSAGNSTDETFWRAIVSLTVIGR